jgi:hypothetical protein
VQLPKPEREKSSVRFEQKRTMRLTRLAAGGAVVGSSTAVSSRGATRSIGAPVARRSTACTGDGVRGHAAVRGSRRSGSSSRGGGGRSRRCRSGSRAGLGRPSAASKRCGTRSSVKFGEDGTMTLTTLASSRAVVGRSTAVSSTGAADSIGAPEDGNRVSRALQKLNRSVTHLFPDDPPQVPVTAFIGILQ